MAIFDNGESSQLGTLAIAKFNNIDGLDRIGSNNFIATETSGTASAGNANTEGRGALVGGTLEQSNVDASREFIDLIRYQRGYQAGSQVISTMNDVINTTLQLA